MRVFEGPGVNSGLLVSGYHGQRSVKSSSDNDPVKQGLVYLSLQSQGQVKWLSQFTQLLSGGQGSEAPSSISTREPTPLTTALPHPRAARDRAEPNATNTIKRWRRARHSLPWEALSLCLGF